MRYTTESGLVVTDRRHNRSDGGIPPGPDIADPDDPRHFPPNDKVSPPVGVGPMTSEASATLTSCRRPASTHPPVQAWSGWPVECTVPNGGGSVGLPEMISRVPTVIGATDLNSSILFSMPPDRTVNGEVAAAPASDGEPAARGLHELGRGDEAAHHRLPLGRGLPVGNLPLRRRPRA